MGLDLRKKTKSAIIWNSVNKFGKSGSQFIVTIILARLLTPADFGMIAMILVITRFGDIFIDGGFLLGIVQQKELNPIELSSVFFVNIGVGFCICAIIFLGAPLIGLLYHNPKLVPLSRLISLVYFISSFSIVQHALMIRDMDFKKRTIAQLVAQVVAGIVGIITAIMGLGVWSLVIYMLLQASLSALLYWVQTDWRPQMMIKISSIKSLWKFSANLLGVSLLGNVAGRIDIFLTGEFFTPGILGLYSKAKDFAILPVGIGSEIINTSLYPAMAKISDDEQKFNLIYTDTLKLIIFIFAPFFGIMTLCAKDIVFILLGPKWVGSMIYFRWFSLMALFYIINDFLIYVINAKGRSDVNLKKELIQTPVRIAGLLLLIFIFKPLNILYFTFFLILFFISSNIYTQYLISRICRINFFRNCCIGVKYVVLILLILLAIQWLSLDFNNHWLALFTKTFLLLGSYLVILAITRDQLFYKTLKKALLTLNILL